jgi:SAM-dependent methyltransferase
MAQTTQPVSGFRYEEWYTGDRYLKQHPTWHANEAEWKADQVMRMIERNRLDPRSVVDIGCGNGGVLAEMQSQLHPDCVLKGYDIAPAAIAMAAARANDRLSFAVGDVTGMPELRTDLILVLDVLEHIEDIYTFLRTIKPMSRYKIFHMGLNLSVQKVLRGKTLVDRQQDGEIHQYTKELALQLLQDVGYEIQDHFYTGMALDLNDARGRLRDGDNKPPVVDLRNLVLRGPRRVLYRVNRDFAVRLLGGYHLMILTA